MTFENGRFVSDSVDDVLDILVTNFEAEAGDVLAPGAASMLRTIYRPVAVQIVELQEDIGLVLDSSQIDHATGAGLDLLTALIGVIREDAVASTGTVTFSRDSAASQDYTIPAGTKVQTESTDPVVFTTDEEVTLANGTTSVDAAVTAEEGSAHTNVAAGTITVLVSSVPGVEAVTNAAATTGGADGEDDEALRERAKGAVAEGKTATAKALIRAVEQVDGVAKVQIFVNNRAEDNTGTGGLPPHSFELIVDGGADLDVGQKILDTMAAGATPYGGANGTAVTVAASLPSGTTENVSFSRPTTVAIYVDLEIETTNEYVGDDMLKDAIVQYIGGTLSNGVSVSGKIDMGSEVLYGEVEYAIRSVHGVYDVLSLEVDRVDPPTNTTNLNLASGEVTSTNATDGSITITKTAL